MGTLFIVSTPIGNLEDITLRAIKTLSSVDAILCEDTRHTGLLLQHLNIKNIPLIRIDDHTQLQKAPEIVQMLEQGKNIALVSDAGTPLISDPGFLLVREALKHGIKVVSIPGPSAVIAALTSSGLPTDKFFFLGYPPEKTSHRLKVFQSLPKDTTIIFYCAPHKLTQTLEDMKEVFGDIEITLARELTKVHEEIVNLKISEALSENFRGEIVLLFSLGI
ncbi:16S rRNA (cytidine(1402)-2'-O)-methyltransferase [Candidatus Gottesmanbacteria bacterium]|nr:16S rRNA (cytidine(1402)-2'-O)-methyltransferase [Candidatus Gottesmanbacteria bacterium]